MDLEHFGSCTLYVECMEACPTEISHDTITRMNGDFLRATAQPPAKEAASAAI
jgi:succinate dehydrogenase/fumarate reductase-like Fe-S protein